MQQLRLAVYGHINRNGGSGPGSNYLLLEHLLQAGHAIDLYAIEGFVGTQGLERYPNLIYRPSRIPLADTVFSFLYEKLPPKLGWLPAFAWNKVRHWLYYRKISRLIARHHEQQSYDALLVLDLLMPFRRNPSLYCVNWPQSTPLGELEGIRNQKENLIKLCGRLLYWNLVIYYWIKVALVRQQIRRCDRLVCCSSWTLSSWKQLGVLDGDAVSFALDLETFHPSPKWLERSGPVTFLHLGRIVPRKRLDLLLEAFRRLRKEVADARLLIIGQFSYAKGYQALVRPEALPTGVEYRPSIARAQAPDLLRNVDVLIQPSEFEDFGSAVMEAQGCGLPVIVGPTNGTKDYISKSSFVFASYTPAALCQAMRQAVAALRVARPALARDARQSAETHFTVEALAERVVSIVLKEKMAQGSSVQKNCQGDPRHVLIRESAGGARLNGKTCQ